MHNIKIEDIELEPIKKLSYKFDEFMEEFGTEIHAKLECKSIGDFIEISGNIKGNLKLVCDRCMEEYDYKLDIDIDETFAKNSLQDEYSQEYEIQNGQFITDLNGADEIDIYDLLYQSVTLSLPNKKVCGINCKGIFVSDEMNDVQDERMAIFKSIPIEKKK